ncbi:MAG: DUF2163 domain-containing protein [Robiginitomaculum sp.]
MRNFSQDFSAHIKGETTTLCWAWKLKRKDGLVLGFSDHDRALTIEGLNYQAASGFAPTDIENRLGFSLDNSAVLGALSADAITKSDIEAGLYDGADVEIWRVNWQDTTQLGLIWRGRIGEISLIDGRFEAELVGQSAALEQSTGRVFSRQCQADFGSEICGVRLEDYPEGTKCPHSFEACKTQFQNTDNFLGFPYLIGDDAVLGAPQEGDVKDGSSRYG